MNPIPKPCTVVRSANAAWCPHKRYGVQRDRCTHCRVLLDIPDTGQTTSLLTNLLSQVLTLTSLGVLAGDKTLRTLSGDNLSHWTRIVGTVAPTTRSAWRRTCPLQPGFAARDETDVAHWCSKS
jgi:hypothetical protein